MTAKEKTEELVREFKKYAYYPKTKDDEIFVNELKTNAKQCALIAVDEILKAIPDASDDNSPYNSELLWWKEVRHEIENLKN